MVRAPYMPFLTSLLLLGGCASRVPDTIREAPAVDVDIVAVRAAPEKFMGATLRWGGVIVAVRNLKDETQIEIVSRRLDDAGRPREEDRSDGRFIVSIPGFLDPAVHASGRDVTVHGRLDGTIARTIDEYPYLYPIVRADRFHLWEPRPEPVRAPYYDPFYYPGYPFGPYPWPRPRY